MNTTSLLGSTGSRRIVALLLASLVLLSAATGVVAARSITGIGGTMVVPAGDTVDSISGVAGSVVVRGTVTGDVSVAAGSVHVAPGGEVGGDVAAANGSVDVEGTFGGDVSAASGSVTVAEGASIGGSLSAGAQTVTIDGSVGGDVVAGADTIVVGPAASIGGELRYDAQTLTRDPGASIAGGVVRDESIGSGFDVGVVGLTISSWLAAVYGILVNLLLGALLLGLAPRFSGRVADGVGTSPATTGGVGLLTLVAVPIVLVLLAVTIIGIPLSFVGAVLFGLLVWIAAVYGQFAVAYWLLGELGTEERWLALAVGVVGFGLLGLVPVVGGLAQFVAFILGLGAVLLGLREAYRGRGEEPTPGGRQSTLDEGVGDERPAA